MERYIPVAQTRLKPPRVWLLFMKAGYKRAVLRTTILSNGKGISVRPTETGLVKVDHLHTWSIFRNSPFHLMYQPEFWFKWKGPVILSAKLREGSLESFKVISRCFYKLDNLPHERKNVLRQNRKLLLGR